MGKAIKSIDDAIEWLDIFLEEMDEFYGLAALKYGDEAYRAMKFIHYYRMKELEKEWDKEDDIELLLGRWFLALEDTGCDPWEIKECVEMADQYVYTKADYKKFLRTIA